MTMTSSPDCLVPVEYDPTDRLLHPAPAVRTRAVLALAEQAPDEDEHECVARKLALLLHDRVPAVVEAVTATLDRLVVTSPDFFAALRAVVREDGSFNVPLVAYLLRTGRSEAIEAVLGGLDAPDTDGAWLAVIEAVAAAPAVTGARLERLIYEGTPDQRRAGAHVLSRRGVAGATRLLFEQFASRALVRQYLERGPAGIQIMCSAVPCPAASDAFIADRLAAQRKRTAATIYVLAETPALCGDRVAARVLGHWDEPRSVELLRAMAEDPARREDVREAALAALCALEAPEAIDVLGRAIVNPESDDLTRRQCERALEAIGNEDALQMLRRVRKELRRGPVRSGRERSARGARW